MKLLGFALVVMALVIAASPRVMADARGDLKATPGHEIAMFDAPVALGEYISPDPASVKLSETVGESAPGAATPTQPEIAKPAVSDVSTITGPGLIKSAHKHAIRTVTRTANGLPGPLGRSSSSATPEPSSLLLLGFGLLGLAFVVFRKAKSSEVVAQE
jgi:hypothetical protein